MFNSRAILSLLGIRQYNLHFINGNLEHYYYNNATAASRASFLLPKEKRSFKKYLQPFINWKYIKWSLADNTYVEVCVKPLD